MSDPCYQQRMQLQQSLLQHAEELRQKADEKLAPLDERIKEAQKEALAEDAVARKELEAASRHLETVREIEGQMLACVDKLDFNSMAPLDYFEAEGKCRDHYRAPLQKAWEVYNTTMARAGEAGERKLAAQDRAIELTQQRRAYYDEHVNPRLQQLYAESANVWGLSCDEVLEGLRLYSPRGESVQQSPGIASSGPPEMPVEPMMATDPPPEHSPEKEIPPHPTGLTAGGPPVMPADFVGPLAPTGGPPEIPPDVPLSDYNVVEDVPMRGSGSAESTMSPTVPSDSGGGPPAWPDDVLPEGQYRDPHREWTPAEPKMSISPGEREFPPDFVDPTALDVQKSSPAVSGPPITPNEYVQTIDDFDVENNPSYKPNRLGKKETYCNKFVLDVTAKMGVPIPRKIDGEWTTANRIDGWLANEGKRHGWEEVTPEQAQEYANRGFPAVGSLKNPKGHGHVAVVRPGGDPNNVAENGPLVAQAGLKNFNSEYARIAFAGGTRWLRVSLRRLGQYRWYVNRIE